MTRDETKKIVMIIASTYPNWHPSDMSFTVDAWALMLESFTYRQEITKSRETRKIPQDVLEALEQSNNRLIENK